MKNVIRSLIQALRAGFRHSRPDGEKLPSDRCDFQHRTEASHARELKGLEGSWAGVSLHVDGFQDRVADWYRYSFDDDQMTTETSEADPQSVKFRLDPSANPKRLDTSIVVEGVEETTPGIYALNDDELILAWRVGGERPVDFTSCDGDEKIVLRLCRINA